MMRYIKMFLTHVQTPLHCSNCQKSPISMFFWWFSERDEKQLRYLFQPQMLHSDAQCFFKPLEENSPPPLTKHPTIFWFIFCVLSQIMQYTLNQGEYLGEKIIVSQCTLKTWFHPISFSKKCRVMKNLLNFYPIYFPWLS